MGLSDLRLPRQRRHTSGLGIDQMNARGTAGHPVVLVVPLQEHLQIVEADFHETVRCVHQLFAVDLDIDLFQPLFRQGNSVAIAGNSIRALVVYIDGNGFELL